MTKNKHSNPDSQERRPKKKTLSASNEVTPDQMVHKKRKKDELQASSVIPDAPVLLKSGTRSNKKHKKKTKTKSAESSDPPSCPEEIVHQGEEDLSLEERRVLERKMKKILKKEEKKRLKEDGETLPKSEGAGPSAAQQALDYLTCWAENRSEWKFQKTRQTWLLQHLFDSEKISDEKFCILLPYLEGLRGGARDTTVQKALALVQQSGDQPEDADIHQRAQRAREVIQLLS